MPLDRLSLKSDAKTIIKNSKPSVLHVSFVYLILLVLFGALSSNVLYGKVSASDLDMYYDFVANGEYDYALSYFSTLMPGSAARTIDAVLSILLLIVGAGYALFLLNTVRGTLPCLGNLLDGFGFPFKIIFLNIIEAVFISLWSFLFIIPGIVAAYRYSMAVYILIDDPTKSPLQCLRESKMLMTGHKMELFILDLSFIGWHILASIPVIGYGVKVWSLPYINTTKALYYDRLTAMNYSRFNADFTDWQ